MAELSRYNAGGEEIEIAEGVLKNKGNITDRTRLENIETLLLHAASAHFDELLTQGEIQFNLSFLFEVHRFFLGTLYTWAGKTRTVNMSKDDTFFIPVTYLPNALKELDQIVQRNIPTINDTKKDIAQKVAIIHCEFNAIHPFREGNGRTIRLFLDLLVRNVDYEPIHYELTPQKSYLAACIDGMKQEYTKMETVIYRGLKKKK